MKTKITLALALFAFSFANAQQKEVEQELNSAKGVQFQNGDMFLEGSIKIKTGDAEDTYSINPKFGYFVSDKLAIGADVDYTNTKKVANDFESNGFGVGAFARYYFLQLDSKRFKAYAEAGLGYDHSREEYTTLSTTAPFVTNFDNTTNGVKANVTVGLNYFITKNIAATFVLANVVSYNNSNPESGDATNDFSLNINLFENIFDQPQFGLLYKF